MSKDMFDGFTINLFLDEDSDYLAHFVEMPNVSAFSDTPENALKELAMAWEGVKKSYRKHREPIPQAPSQKGYKRPFNLPVDEELYHALTDEVAKAGMSLYACAAQKLKSTESVVQEGQKMQRFIACILLGALLGLMPPLLFAQQNQSAEKSEQKNQSRKSKP